MKTSGSVLNGEKRIIFWSHLNCGTNPTVTRAMSAVNEMNTVDRQTRELREGTLWGEHQLSCGSALKRYPVGFSHSGISLGSTVRGPSNTLNKFSSSFFYIHVDELAVVFFTVAMFLTSPPWLVIGGISRNCEWWHSRHPAPLFCDSHRLIYIWEEQQVI